MTVSTSEIQQGDCIELMQQMETGSVDLAFADPPFNIGYEYDQYHDRRDDDEYVAWSTEWMRQVHRLLKPNGTFWLAIGDEFAAELRVAARRDVGFIPRSWIIWYYTFGVNCKRAFSRSHTHLLHFVKDDNFTFNAQDPLVRVPSARALVYGDKRANPLGRLPDNTWVLRPQDVPDGFQPMDDSWYYARVAGTFKERQGFHGCQMPEQLLGRIIRVSSNPGDVVFDPFVGSGTTLAVAKKLGRRGLGCELSSDYVELATARIDDAHEGEELTGPADPIASAPATAEGVRLDSAGNRVSGRIAENGSSEADSQRALPGFAPDPIPAEPPQVAKLDLRELLRDGLLRAFQQSNQGSSLDWLLADADLQASFHEACRRLGLIGRPADWNRELLSLRKAGRWGIHSSAAARPRQDDAAHDDDFAAEIAWRLVTDRTGSRSLDDIFCDPEKASFFDDSARRFVSGVPASKLRWAALRLRKARKQIVSEVKRYDYVLNRRDFARYMRWSSCQSARFAEAPGVYMLRGRQKQPIYIGAARDLGKRIERHKSRPASSRRVESVAIISQDELPSAEYLELLRVDLVRRYRPALNVDLCNMGE